MKNNKRFLFPFACVCVLASQIIPLITYHKTLKLFSVATTKNSAVVPFLSPSRALLLSLLLWNNCSTNLLLRKKKHKHKQYHTKRVAAAILFCERTQKLSHARIQNAFQNGKKKIIVRARRTTTATAKNPSEQSKHRYATKSRDRARKRER